MVEFLVRDVSPTRIFEVLESISPRRYWLHNRAGGDGWEVSFGFTVTIKIEDDLMATYAMLKLKR